MKKLIILFIISLLVCCSGTRKLTSTSSASAQLEAKAETHENATLNDKSATQRDSTGSRTQSNADTTQSDVSIKITDYDTNRPVDPTTGKPPVLRETEINSRQSSRHRSETNQQSNVSDKNKKDVKSASNKSAKSDLKSKSKETTKLVEVTKTGVRWWVWVLIVLALGSIIYLAFRFSWFGKVIRFSQRIFK